MATRGPGGYPLSIEPIKNPSLLSYIHPALAALSLVLAFLVLRGGLTQRDQRVRRVPAPPPNLARHVALGPWASSLIGLSALGGVISAWLLRGWKPLATAHGWLGLACAVLFALVWWLGRRLLVRDKKLANRHGVLGATALFLGGLAALLGIALLP